MAEQHNKNSSCSKSVLLDQEQPQSQSQKTYIEEDNMKPSAKENMSKSSPYQNTVPDTIKVYELPRPHDAEQPSSRTVEQPSDRTDMGIVETQIDSQGPTCISGTTPAALVAVLKLDDHVVGVGQSSAVHDPEEIQSNVPDGASQGVVGGEMASIVNTEPQSRTDDSEKTQLTDTNVNVMVSTSDGIKPNESRFPSSETTPDEDHSTNVCPGKVHPCGSQQTPAALDNGNDGVCAQSNSAVKDEKRNLDLNRLAIVSNDSDNNDGSGSNVSDGASQGIVEDEMASIVNTEPQSRTDDSGKTQLTDTNVNVMVSTSDGIKPNESRFSSSETTPDEDHSTNVCPGKVHPCGSQQTPAALDNGDDGACALSNIAVKDEKQNLDLNRHAIVSNDSDNNDKSGYASQTKSISSSEATKTIEQTPSSAPDLIDQALDNFSSMSITKNYNNSELQLVTTSSIAYGSASAGAGLNTGTSGENLHSVTKQISKFSARSLEESERQNNADVTKPAAPPVKGSSSELAGSQEHVHGSATDSFSASDTSYEESVAQAESQDFTDTNLAGLSNANKPYSETCHSVDISTSQRNADQFAGIDESNDYDIPVSEDKIPVVNSRSRPFCKCGKERDQCCAMNAMNKEEFQQRCQSLNESRLNQSKPELYIGDQEEQGQRRRSLNDTLSQQQILSPVQQLAQNESRIHAPMAGNNFSGRTHDHCPPCRDSQVTADHVEVKISKTWMGTAAGNHQEFYKIINKYSPAVVLDSEKMILSGNFDDLAHIREDMMKISSNRASSQRIVDEPGSNTAEGIGVSGAGSGQHGSHEDVTKRSCCRQQCNDVTQPVVPLRGSNDKQPSSNGAKDGTFANRGDSNMPQSHSISPNLPGSHSSDSGGGACGKLDPNKSLSPVAENLETNFKLRTIDFGKQHGKNVCRYLVKRSMKEMNRFAGSIKGCMIANDYSTLVITATSDSAFEKVVAFCNDLSKNVTVRCYKPPDNMDIEVVKLIILSEMEIGDVQAIYEESLKQYEIIGESHSSVKRAIERLDQELKKQLAQINQNHSGQANRGPSSYAASANPHASGASSVHHHPIQFQPSASSLPSVSDPMHGQQQFTSNPLVPRFSYPLYQNLNNVPWDRFYNSHQPGGWPATFSIVKHNKEYLNFQTRSGLQIEVKIDNMIKPQDGVFPNVIVSPCNEKLVCESGLSEAIMKFVGPLIEAECKAHLSFYGPISVRSFLAKDVTRLSRRDLKYVLFAAGPRPDLAGNRLHSMTVETYFNCLRHANWSLLANSITLPPIGAGNYQVPMSTVVGAAVQAIRLLEQERVQSHQLWSLDKIFFISIDKIAVQKMVEEFKKLIRSG